jgi:hypothetical protein
LRLIYKKITNKVAIFQNVGELDRFFVSQFFHEFENQCHLIDENGIQQHNVDFILVYQ